MPNLPNRSLQGGTNRVTPRWLIRGLVGAVVVVIGWVALDTAFGATDHWRSAREGAITLVVWLLLQPVMDRWLRRRADTNSDRT